MMRLWLLLTLLVLVGCGAPAKAITPTDVVSAFKAAGLEAEGVRPMTRDDYGMAPMAEEGVRFFIPSLGADAGGRVMRYASDAELERARNYYTEVGKASAAFFSHLFTRDRLLVQINGSLPDDKAKLYADALAGIR